MTHFLKLYRHKPEVVWFRNGGLCPQLNAVERVSSLPLVSSTYGLVSSVYSSTKHTHRYLRSVCEAAEQGVRSLGSAALLTASPIIHRLEPQSESGDPGPNLADPTHPPTFRERTD